MANNTLVSKIDGKWIHDVSSLHGITLSGTTLNLQWGNPSSAYSTTSSITLNFDAMHYKGIWSTKTGTPTNPENGDTYKISAAGEYTINETKVTLEIGDMIIYDANTASWNIIQANIDPTIYARLTHTHSATLNGSISDATITPKGTISVAVSGANSTFTGPYTPAGNVSTAINEDLSHSHDISIGASTYVDLTVPNANTGETGGNTIDIDSHDYTPEGVITGYVTTETVTDQSASHKLTFNGVAHSHSFNGTEDDIKVNYDKANANTGSTSPAVTGTITMASYKPEGDVSVVLDFDSTAADVSNKLSVANHSHSFTGSTTTFTGPYTPAGTITLSVDNSISSNSVEYATGSISTTTDSAVKTVTLTSVSLNTMVKAGATSTVSKLDVSYVEADEELKHIITPISVLTGIDVSTTNVGTGITTGTFEAIKSVVLATSSFTNITNVKSTAKNAAFNGTPATIAVSGKPQGSTNNATASLTGTLTVNYNKAKVSSASFEGTAKAPEVSTFSLTAANHSHSIGTSSAQATGKFTPSGTIGTTTATGSITGSITYSYIKATGISATFEGTVATLSHGTVTMPSHSHSIGTTSESKTININIKGNSDSTTLGINKTFTGTLNGDEAIISVSGTPQLGTPTGTFYGEAENHNHNNTLTVNVSEPVDTNA